MAYLNAALGENRTPRTVSGAPVNGTDNVQTITFGGTITGGTFKLVFKGQKTTPITWSTVDETTRDDIDAALGALSTVGGAANVTAAIGTASDGIGTFTVTFVLAKGKSAQPLMTVESSLTGTAPTVAVTLATAGVTATHRGAPTGALLIRTSNGTEYRNTGTPTAPTWTLQASPSAEMAALESAIPVAAVVSVTAADAAAQAAADAVAVVGAGVVTPGAVGYVQADTTAAADAILELKATVNALVTLANTNKAKINILTTLANSNKAQLNLALAGLRTAGVITP